MRDMEIPGTAKGVCPIADCMPDLMPENDLVVDIFQRAEGSAESVQTETKTYNYLKPTEVESVMRLLDVDEDFRPEAFYRVMVLQDIVNHNRPARSKKAPKGNRGSGRRHFRTSGF